ncbi:hypothetical protein DL93DRAFT_2165390 [Clavulina sp. PMI_390]|nr:hypothetical protein DL93DRAFT_2165390 [Clavulina sp. PMI_390]
MGQQVTLHTKSFALWLFLILSPITRVSAISIMWPNVPEYGTDVSVQFSGGVAPYKLQVLDNTSNYVYWTWTGDEMITFWHVNADPGIFVVFKVTNSAGATISSASVGVSPNPGLSSTSLQSIASHSVASLQSIVSRASISSVSTESRASIADQTTTRTTSKTITSSPTTSAASGTSTISSPSGTVADGTAGSPSLTSSTTSSGLPTTTPASNTSPSQGPSKHSRIAALVGGVVGGVVVVCIILLVFLWFRRRKAGGAINLPSSAYLSPDDRKRYFDNRTETTTYVTGTSLYTGARSASFPEDNRPMRSSFLASHYPLSAVESAEELEKPERYPPAAANFTGLPEVQQ